MNNFLREIADIGTEFVDTMADMAETAIPGGLSTVLVVLILTVIPGAYLLAMA